MKKLYPLDPDFIHIIGDEVYEREGEGALNIAVNDIWTRRVSKISVVGIHGILFYGRENKKEYYPDRTDEGACNPEGSGLRA